MSNKIYDYLNSYTLSIYGMDINSNDDEEDSSELYIVIDARFPELTQKLSYLWMNKDIYSEEKSKKVIGFGAHGDNKKNEWSVVYKNPSKCKEVFKSIQKNYPSTQQPYTNFHPNITYSEDGDIINIRIPVNCDTNYTGVLADILDIMLI